MRTCLVGLATLALLGLAACGGGDAPAGDDSAAGSSSGATAGAAPEEAADVPDDLCSLVSAEELGDALGVTVTTEPGPVDTCDFGEEDPRGVSGSYGVVPAEDNGGYAAYRSGMTSVMEDPEVTAVDGLGAAAEIAFGSLAGGYGTQAAGAADLGSVVVTTNVLGGDQDRLTERAEAVLRLAVAVVE